MVVYSYASGWSYFVGFLMVQMACDPMCLRGFVES